MCDEDLSEIPLSFSPIDREVINISGIHLLPKKAGDTLRGAGVLLPSVGYSPPLGVGWDKSTE
jgi:hypothetical protein